MSMFTAMKIYKKYAKQIKSGKIKNESDLFKMLKEDGIDDSVIGAAKEQADKKQNED